MTSKQELERSNHLNRLIVDKVYRNDNASLTICSGEGSFIATAETESGKVIEVPFIRKVAPELVELIEKIVDRGLVMEFNPLLSRAFLRPSSGGEIASYNLQSFSFSGIISYFEEQSR